MRVVGTYDWWVLSFIFSSASFGAVGGGPQQHPHLLLKGNNDMSHKKKPNICGIVPMLNLCVNWCFVSLH